MQPLARAVARALAVLLPLFFFVLGPIAAQQAQAGWLKFKLSKSMEKTLGEQALSSFSKDPGLITKGKDYEQVQRIGNKLVSSSNLTEYKYQFHLVKDDTVNAFATAGGHIYVHQGLVDAMGYDESQLAGVMAHELGHAKDRHVARGTEKMIQAQLGLGALSIFFGKNNKDLIEALGGVTGLASLKYSRDMEEWADRYGVEFTYNAGYDAFGLTRGLQTLEGLYGGGNKVEEWMQNHPATNDRIGRTRRIAEETTGRNMGYTPIPVPPKQHVLYPIYGKNGSFYQSSSDSSGPAGKSTNGGVGKAESYSR